MMANNGWGKGGIRGNSPSQELRDKTKQGCFCLMWVLYPSNREPSAVCSYELMDRLFILPTLIIPTPPTFSQT